jgi:hypothetical protein
MLIFGPIDKKLEKSLPADAMITFGSQEDLVCVLSVACDQTTRFEILFNKFHYFPYIGPSPPVVIGSACNPNNRRERTCPSG